MSEEKKEESKTEEIKQPSPMTDVVKSVVITEIKARVIRANGDIEEL